MIEGKNEMKDAAVSGADDARNENVEPEALRKSDSYRPSRSKGKKLSLEETFAELDSLLEKLEKEESLEKSYALYKKGVTLLKSANESIDRIEKEVRVLENGDEDDGE